MADTLANLIDKGASLADLTQLSDGLGVDDRMQQMRALGAKQLGKLYETAAGQRDIVALDYFLADRKAATAEWFGKNSLPVFSAFSKLFTHSTEGGTLTGHNKGATQWLIGPGYFTTLRHPERGQEFLFDYTRYPPAAPPGWPPFKRNESGVSRVVFYDMHDYFRPVGGSLGIGGAYTSKGKFKGQYFALCRGPVLPIGA